MGKKHCTGEKREKERKKERGKSVKPMAIYAYTATTGGTRKSPGPKLVQQGGKSTH